MLFIEVELDRDKSNIYFYFIAYLFLNSDLIHYFWDTDLHIQGTGDDRIMDH